MMDITLRRLSSSAPRGGGGTGLGTQGGLGCRCQWGSAGSGYGRGNGNVDWLHPRVSSHPVNGSATHDWNGPGRWGTSGGEADGRRVVELTLLVQSHVVMWMMEGLDGMLRGGRAADGGPSPLDGPTQRLRLDGGPSGRGGGQRPTGACLVSGGMELGAWAKRRLPVAYQPVLVGVPHRLLQAGRPELAGAECGLCPPRVYGNGFRRPYPRLSIDFISAQMAYCMHILCTCKTNRQNVVTSNGRLAGLEVPHNAGTATASIPRETLLLYLYDVSVVYPPNRLRRSAK